MEGRWLTTRTNVKGELWPYRECIQTRLALLHKTTPFRPWAFSELQLDVNYVNAIKYIWVEGLSGGLSLWFTKLGVRQ